MTTAEWCSVLGEARRDVKTYCCGCCSAPTCEHARATTATTLDCLIRLPAAACGVCVILSVLFLLSVYQNVKADVRGLLRGVG